MKFQVSLKDPDGFSTGVDDAAKKAIAAIEGIDDHERELLLETRVENIRNFMCRWVEYGEYVSLEFDTESDIATVVVRR